MKRTWDPQKLILHSNENASVQPLLCYGAIAIAPHGLVLIGPQSRFNPAIERYDMKVLCTLEAWHWHSWLQRDAQKHADRLTPLPDVLLGAATDTTILRWIEQGIRQGRRTALTPIIDAILQALADPVPQTVESITGRLGVNHSMLSRLCKRHFGFAPKLLLRRERFLRTLAHLRRFPRGSWSDVLDPGYVDQSHFIRDAQHFLGMSPTAYFRRELTENSIVLPTTPERSSPKEFHYSYQGSLT